MSLYSQPFLSITSSAIVGEGGSLTSCALIVSYFKEFVKGFFKIFLKKFVSRMVGSTQLPRTVRPPEGSQLLGESLPLTSLLYHNSGNLSRGLLKKIATFFQRAVSYTVWAWLRHTDFSVLYPNGAGSTRPVPYPLDTISIPQTAPKVN